jgi:TRAP-type C4-dicarboxylate transport system permease small subunit
MATQSNATVARTGGNPFLRAVNAISTVAGWAAAAMILASVFITCQMIFVRFVLNGSTVWQTEAVIYLMVASTMIGLSYVQRMRGHVNVDLVPLALGLRARFWLAVITLGLSIAIVAVLFWYAYDFWHLAYTRNWKSETVWAVRLWIPYSALPLGFGLLLMQLVADFVALLTGTDKPFGLETE